MDIYANEAVIYENLVATMDLAGISPCSDSGMFFCIEITKNPLSSRPFKLEGNLVGCTEIECRGMFHYLTTLVGGMMDCMLYVQTCVT